VSPQQHALANREVSLELTVPMTDIPHGIPHPGSPQTDPANRGDSPKASTRNIAAMFAVRLFIVS
jgi:hypothetical protein